MGSSSNSGATVAAATPADPRAPASSTPPLADSLAKLRGNDDSLVDCEPACQVEVRATPRRVRGKVAPPQWMLERALLQYRVLEAQGVRKHGWRIYQDVQSAWRTYYIHMDKNRLAELGQKSELSKPQKRALAAEAWKALPEAERAYWVMTMHLLQRPARVAPVVECAEADDQAGDWCNGLGEDRNNYLSSAFLITYNGDWGLQLEDTKALLQKRMTVHQLTEALKVIPFYRTLFEQFKTFLVLAAQKLRASDVSCSLEHSTKSEVRCRVHLQAFLSERTNKIDLWNGRWRELTFDGVAPSHLSKCQSPNAKRRDDKGASDVSDLTDGSRSSAAATARIMEGHYYFSYPKVGGLFQWSTLKKYEDYFPRVRWVQNAVHARKMLLGAADDELYETRQPCKGMIDHVKKLVEREEEKQAAEEQRAENARFRLTASPFGLGPPHVAARLELWRRVKEGLVDKPPRSKPIVIDGPSQMDKSQWALQHYGDRTPAVNCQGVTEPPLRYYQARQSSFDAIVFEEGSWELVCHNKMLFQSTNAQVDMASSATNCHSYRVRAHCVPMFITANEFFVGIDDEKNIAAKDYVEKNIEFWRIDSPLYRQESPESG